MDTFPDSTRRTEGGQLVLKPALRMGRVPDDDAVYLMHGTGLARYVYRDFRPTLKQAVTGDEFGLGAVLNQRVEQWARWWQALAQGLPPRHTPEYCREFDIQSYNREALALCHEIVPLLPAGQQLCYTGAKRKACYHRSRLLEHGDARLEQHLPDYFSDQRDPDKWVRVMGDYGGNGIWHWSGYVMEPDYLAIPAALKSRLADWAERYSTWLDSWSQGEADDFARFQADDLAIASHSREGLEIARAIKAHLPDWTVVYFDEDLCGRHEMRSKYQFEVS